ncbi:40999_t:CDS:2 [Gigaspora margarita]|uniref:40999_t:CDS:1 n=1 Tax=Gigaspora margarita TaxID=4874 RepID=A0ABN7URQ6_GIGMA|nr:40999_t:CDS:2 [Gigaspora margarita]
MDHDISTTSMACDLNYSVSFKELIGDNRSNYAMNKKNGHVIQNRAIFSSWESLENILKEYELKIRFKSINNILYWKQSNQWVESMNRIIKSEICAKTMLLNLGNAIQIKLEHEAQHQQLSEYKNALPTQILLSILNDNVKKYLTLESASIQTIQISQNVLYQACLVESLNNLILPLKAYKYSEGYLEDEYDALQASLEAIVNIVHCETFDSLLIMDTTMEQDTIAETNQVISIREPDVVQSSIYKDIMQKQEYAYGFGIAKSGLKFAIKNGLVDEFVGLVTRFIEYHTGSNFMQRDILQDLDMEQENSRPAKWVNNKVNNRNVKPILETRYCGNCYGTDHYTPTCKFPKNYFK